MNSLLFINAVSRNLITITDTSARHKESHTILLPTISWKCYSTVTLDTQFICYAVKSKISSTIYSPTVNISNLFTAVCFDFDFLRRKFSGFKITLFSYYYSISKIKWIQLNYWLTKLLTTFQDSIKPIILRDWLDCQWNLVIFLFRWSLQKTETWTTEHRQQFIRHRVTRRSPACRPHPNNGFLSYTRTTKAPHHLHAGTTGRTGGRLREKPLPGHLLQRGISQEYQTERS